MSALVTGKEQNDKETWSILFWEKQTYLVGKTILYKDLDEGMSSQLNLTKLRSDDFVSFDAILQSE